MSRLLVRGRRAEAGATQLVEVTPLSAGWNHVGFEALRLADGERVNRGDSARETCVVVIAGTCDIRSRHAYWRGLGSRCTPFDGGPPAAAYLPPGCRFSVEGRAGGAEIGLCSAPARAVVDARVLNVEAMPPEERGHGSHQRFVQPILMGDEPAGSLLVCEVITPAGHWSSYPPHKHDREALPVESQLEETYYHRVSPARGFGLQRVYTEDRSIDESIAFSDGDVVLVPSGYHTVSAPPGYRLYYLNVMAGPARVWAVATDPDHEWQLRS